MTQQHHLNHATWGLQISCGFHTEVPEESNLRENQEEPWRRVPRLGAAAGKPDRGGAFDDGSCPHAGFDPAEIFGCRGDRLHQGQKLDLDRAEHRAKGEELHRAQVLGARIFRLDGGSGRGDDPGLHQRNQELQDRQMDQLALIP
jgi:hypothetical protein